MANGETSASNVGGNPVGNLIQQKNILTLVRKYIIFIQEVKMKKSRKSYPKKDLTNKKFGKLTPVEWVKGGFWICKCDCGKMTKVDTRNLSTGHTRSCGCKLLESKNFYDMINYEHESIKILKRAGSDNQRIAFWECLCKKCNTVFLARGSSIRAGLVNSCGCVRSYNECKIANMLYDAKVDFKREYSFHDLKGHRKKLRFDFAIFQDKKLSHLLEFQGKQHFEKPKGSWSNNFVITQKYDQIKREYCKKNNIPLVEIRYDEEYTIDKLLNYEPVETIPS